MDNSQWKRFELAMYIFAGVMLLAIITMPLYITSRQTAQTQTTEVTLRAGLVSTSVLPNDESAPPATSPRVQGTPSTEVVVTRVVNNETHLIAATVTPGVAAPVIHETVATDTQTTSENGMRDTLPGNNQMRGVSPIPTPISPIPTPVSPLATPEPPPLPPNSDIIQAFVQSIVDAQNAYYAANGRYAQVLVGSAPECPDSACIALVYPVGVTMAVNSYLSPAGDGYEIVVVSAGWELTVNHGPEMWRSTGWRYEP